MTESIQKILSLVNEYYDLSDGKHILYPTDYIHIHTTHREHIYHSNHTVEISRKAIKHFVESRKRQLLAHHDETTVKEILVHMVGEIPQIIDSYDSYEYRKPNDFLFMRTSNHPRIPNVRIILEKYNEKTLHIKSIHITKHKKTNS
jgi:hypothetical protein